MKCDEVMEHAQQYLKISLSQGEADQLDKHLDGCESCRAKLETLMASETEYQLSPEAEAQILREVGFALALEPKRQQTQIEKIIGDARQWAERQKQAVIKFPKIVGRSHSAVEIPTQALAAATHAQSPEPHFYESDDGQLTASVRQTPRGTTVIIFLTEDETLAGATVEFRLVPLTRADTVEKRGTVRLEPVEEGLWEGEWEERIVLSEPCELRFETINDRAHHSEGM